MTGVKLEDMNKRAKENGRNGKTMGLCWLIRLDFNSKYAGYVYEVIFH